MKRIVLDDFSGGIPFGGVRVTERQVLTAKGLIPADQRTLRSQFPFWKDDHDLVRFDAPVFFLDRYGKVFAATQVATAGSVEVRKHEVYSPTTQGTVTWTVRVCGRIRWRMFDDKEWYPAAVLRYELSNGVTEMVLVVGRYSTVVSNGVEFQVPTIVQNLPTTPTVDADLNPVGGALPEARVACMWDDFVVLGDIEWSQQFVSTPGSSTSTKRYSNYIYISDSLDPSKFQVQFPVAVAEDGAQIVGLFPTDEGLLVLTSRTYGISGVVLLRGTPASYWADDMTDSFSRELVAPLDVHVPPEWQTVSDSATYWAHRQSVLFVTDDGGLYEYRSGRVVDISPMQRGSRQPGFEYSGLNRYWDGGAVATFGEWVVFQRGASTISEHRFFTMRAFGSEGVWTELQLGGELGQMSVYTLIPSGTSGVVLRRDGGGRHGDASWKNIGYNCTPAGTEFEEPAFFSSGTRFGVGISAWMERTAPATEFECDDFALITEPFLKDSEMQERWWQQVGVVADNAVVSSISTSDPGGEGSFMVESPSPASSNREILAPAYGPGYNCRISVRLRRSGEMPAVIRQVTFWFDQAGEQW